MLSSELTGVGNASLCAVLPCQQAAAAAAAATTIRLHIVLDRVAVSRHDRTLTTHPDTCPPKITYFHFTKSVLAES